MFLAIPSHPNISPIIYTTWSAQILCNFWSNYISLNLLLYTSNELILQNNMKVWIYKKSNIRNIRNKIYV